MKAAVFYDAKDVRVEEYTLKEMNDDSVKVEVAWAGICGSDLHEYNAGPMTIPGDEPDPLTGRTRPIVMGHEFSGIVAEVGSNVKDFKVGDKVAINPLIVSGEHEPTLYDMYQGFNFFGLGDDGGFAQYAILPEKNLIHLSEDLPLSLGALIEPAAVAVQAIRESVMEFGESVAVFGTGPIGLLQIAAAKAAGASEVFAFDLSDERLEIAKEIGADHVINSGEQDPVKYIKQYYPYGVDRTFEVAGVPITLQQSIQSTRPRGMVTIVSIFEEPIDFNPMILTASGVRISSSLAYEPDIFELTAKMLATGQIEASPVITDKIRLDEIVEEGFEKLLSDKSQSKILVELSGKE